METVISLAIFYAIAAIATWMLERKSNSGLPPPDRSVKRNAEIFDEMARYKARLRHQK
jgi:hypothetical protein